MPSLFARPRAAIAAAALLPAFGAATLPAGAQAAAPASAPSPQAAVLDAATRRDVIDTVAAHLRHHYVDADTGRLIADHLRARLAAGAYDRVADPYRFAEQLGEDLRAVNGDGHLYVTYEPGGSRGIRVGPEGIRMMEPPAAGGGARRGPPPEIVAAERRMHFALGRADVLPGNVGYFELRGFSGASEAEDAVVAALRYLQYTDAMIIDLRRNGGGSAELVNFLISHFTGPDTLASLTVRNRSGNEHFTRYTLASVPGPRRPTVPLYVLTSGYTASAGEDFAFVLKNLGRATVVGASTAGAGHNNAELDAGHGFGVSISFSRTTDPKTGVEWERVGVQPTVAVDQAKALDVAHSLALKTVAEQTPEPRRKRVLELAREAVEARLSPRAVPAATLASYAGEYAGSRTVWVEGGKLLYSPRRGAPADELVPLADDTFANGAVRLVFEREGARVTRLRIAQPAGATLTYARVPSGSGARRG
jgi:hypothetical protein